LESATWPCNLCLAARVQRQEQVPDRFSNIFNSKIPIRLSQAGFKTGLSFVGAYVINAPLVVEESRR
jgi:hypothetical protein